MAFHGRKPFDVYTEIDTVAGFKHWKLKLNEAVPEDWSGDVGDAIHNARAALDLLMVAVVRRGDPDRDSYSHVHFPIRETETAFRDALRSNTRGASAEARNLLRDLQPFKAGDSLIWRLHQLDNLDKHNAIVPVGAMCGGVDIGPLNWRKLRDTSPWPMPEISPLSMILRSADIQYPLADGDILFSYTLNGSGGAPEDHEPIFQMTVAFGEGQIFDGEPVVETLTKICDRVEAIIDQFEQANLAA